jgi:hypothetical protein
MVSSFCAYVGYFAAPMFDLCMVFFWPYVFACYTDAGAVILWQFRAFNIGLDRYQCYQFLFISVGNVSVEQAPADVIYFLLY